MTELGDFVYAADRGDSSTMSSCGTKNCSTAPFNQLTSGNGDQVVNIADITGSLSASGQMQVDQWTAPTITSVCVTCCDTGFHDGNLPDERDITMGGDPANHFILIGDPGLANVAVNGGTPCSTTFSSISQAALLKVFQITNPGKGQLSEVGSTALGNDNQIPVSIAFFDLSEKLLPQVPISFLPLDLTFPPLVPRQFVPHKFTLKDKDGKIPVIVDDVAVNPPFTIAQDMCSGMTIEPGKKCTFQVVCAPTKPGTFTGSVSVQFNGTTPMNELTCVANPLTLKVRGTLKFSATAAGAASRDRLITVRNPTKGTATLETCTIPADFAIGESDGCSGATLGPHAKCQIAVHCAPPAMTAAGTTLTGNMLCPYSYGPDPADVGTTTVALECTSK